jgi:hypothetical protein
MEVKVSSGPGEVYLMPINEVSPVPVTDPAPVYLIYSELDLLIAVDPIQPANLIIKWGHSFTK